ncbi:MAG: hypothetical protein DCC71_10200 [Proteobacteria bacterium]|nr:MAG: hypothetical protein DCC71_10200 [Pseudomonadota bacterium]
MQLAVDAAARESMWRAVEGSFRLGAALIDEGGRVMEATPGLARVFGADSLGGAPLAAHVAEEDRGALAHALREVAGGAPERVLRLRPPAASGPASLELRLVRGEDPTRPLTAIVADRSEQERIERSLLHTERLRLLGEMLLGSAHELNNLLAVILSTSDAVPNPEDAALLRSATEDARRVVSRLYSFGRAPSGDERPERVAPEELLREALEFTRVRWQRQASAAGVSIEVKTRYDACEPVLVARSELRHALVNLIVNAIDAMPRGGVLRLSSGRDGDAAFLRVADTGTGFASEARERILEPFFSTKGEAGLGLGLSIVVATVARHGGQLVADSTPEYGSVFEIRLPLAGEEDAALTPERDAHPLPAPCRVLVVEDNAELRSIVTRILRRDGHEVAEADSAEAALALDLGPGRCDVVIADLSLPGMSGLELASALRAGGHTMPIVLTSAWGVELDESLRQARGVSSVLPKPYRLDALRAALAAAQQDAQPG